MAGKGAFPIISKWVTGYALYQKHLWADADQSLKVLMEKWFFGFEEEILKSWTANLNAVHTFSRPLRFMRHTQTLRTLHSYGRNKLLTFLQALTATHLFSRPTRLMKLTQNVNLTHIFKRPFRMMKLTQTIQGTYVFEAKAPPVVGIRMTFHGIPEQY